MALWNDPRHRVGRAGFESRWRRTFFYVIFFEDCSLPPFKLNFIHEPPLSCSQEQKVVPGLIIYFTKHQKNAVSTMHAMQPMRVCDMCRTNYSHPDLKYGNKHLPVLGELELWHDPRHRVGRAGFKYRRRRAPFYVVFLKTVRCYLNSILFMNLHYSAVRN
jgi:hypothetical protein